MELYFMDKYYETHHAIKIAETKYRNSLIDGYQKEIDELNKPTPRMPKESKRQWNTRVDKIIDDLNDLNNFLSKVIDEKKLSKKASIDIEYRNSAIESYKYSINEIELELDKTRSYKEALNINDRLRPLHRNLEIIMREKYVADERRANEEEEDKYL
jgi:hypothetical protein